MVEEYRIIKNNELKSVHDEFSFSSLMRQASRNELWRNKDALWTVLSGACDDAAKECYAKINNMVSEIADIETCNIHALKSIAKSVDAEFLTKDLNENYDKDILDLINLFSVQREILLNTTTYLHESVTDKTFGYLTLKSLHVKRNKVSIDLLNEIKENSFHLKKLFETNLFSLKSQLIDLLYRDLDDLSLEKLNGSKEHEAFVNSVANSEALDDDNISILKELTIEKILDIIKSYDSGNLIDFTEQKLFINDSINYYYLIIEILKQNYYRPDKKVYFLTSYFDKDKNKDIDLSKLIFKIVGTLFIKDDLYFDEFVGYHFFNTLQLQIINNKIKSNYIFDTRLKKYVLNQEVRNDMSKEEFIANLTSHISYEDALKFINENNLSKFKYEFIDFVKNCTRLNREIQAKENSPDTSSCIELNILKVNYPDMFNDGNFIIEKLYGENGILFYLTKKYVDECIHIRNLRNQLKNLIQQYTFIGTKRIATDIFYEFFIKNFSNKQSQNYMSSDYIITGGNDTYDFNIVKRNISDLINGTLISSTNSFEDDKFSVNVLEYYDETSYLNIDADLPVTFSENIVTSYEEVVSSYVDENYLITSAYVKKPVYTISYVPCSMIVRNYNEKFWKNDKFNISIESNNDNFEDYIKYYSTYINDFNNLSIDVFKNDYIKNVLKPLLENIWDEFALSGVAENDLDSDVGQLYKEYIGNNLGNNKYINNANVTFPTIAPINSIENLVEASEYDTDLLLFLAKKYYSNVLSKVKDATLSILKMYNEDSIPHEGWRQTYITFHGYSTVYENSNNKLLYSVKVSELYKNNGPFVYRKIQEFLYNHYLSKLENTKIDIETFLNDYYAGEKIKNLYDYYLNTCNGNIYFNKNDELDMKPISKYEEDLYESCFTVFKEKNEICGKLFYRSYNMPLSVPIMNAENRAYNILIISNLNIEHVLNEITSKCIDFGFLNEVMWIFGEYENAYKLVSFKYKFVEGFMVIENSSFKSHTISTTYDYLRSLNDYVGTFYDGKTIKFILFDCYDALSNISEKWQKNPDESYNILYNYDLKLLMISLDVDTLEVERKIINSGNNVTPLPMFLKHKTSGLELKNDERIWKITIDNDQCYISYKSLNKKIEDNTFNYYFNYKTISIKVQSLYASWISNLDFIDINNIKDDMIFEKNEIFDTIFIRTDKNDPDQDKLLFENIDSFMIQSKNNDLSGFSNCFIKNDRLYSKISPLNIGYEFTESFNEFLISKIIKKADETYSNSEKYYNLTFDEMLSFFESKDIMNWINTKKWLKDTVINKTITYEDVRASLNKIISLLDNINSSRSSAFKIEHGNIEDTIFTETNEYYDTIPLLKNCCINPLEVSIVFMNDSGITFLNKDSFDVDITCYINDEIEKSRKVGYGNTYNRTNYILWSGDTTNGGSESVKIDVQKYIKNKLKNADVNNIMNIIFNICWHENSEIMTNNLYAIIKWNNLIEKFPITVCGTNRLSCNIKSFELNINMLTNELIIDPGKLYPVISLNYKEKLEGYGGQPDIRLGTINLSTNDFKKLNESGEWKAFNDSIYYLRDKSSISYLLKDQNYSLFKNNPSDMLILYKRILSELIYYKDKNIITKISDIALNETFFGLNHELGDNEIDFNYVVYLNPKYFSNVRKLKYKINLLVHDEIGNLSLMLTEGK